MSTWGSKQGLQSRLVHMTHDAQKLLKCCIRGLAFMHPRTDAGPALCPGDDDEGFVAESRRAWILMLTPLVP